ARTAYLAVPSTAAERRSPLRWLHHLAERYTFSLASGVVECLVGFLSISHVSLRLVSGSMQELTFTCLEDKEEAGLITSTY
ncbi:unnamed protein product, partial [Urochloa humidicola]